MEIERRYLISDMEKVNALIKEYGESKKTIIQDYIYADIITAIRKRLIIKNSVESYVYTVKTGRRGFAVHEYEEEISKEKYDLLEKDPTRITIEKDRYCIPYENNLMIELDVFHGEYEGYVFAEIEFETEEQANNVKVPDWFGTEIGDKITNNKMSKTKLDIKSIIEG